MGKEESTSPPPSEKRRVTPSIRNGKRSQEELIDQPRRRSKRQIKRSDSISIPVTPAPSSSICDSARNSSRSGSNGRRGYSGSRYKLEEELSKPGPSSPERGHANATEKQGDDKASNESPRHCYCDEYSQSCTSNRHCELHVMVSSVVDLTIGFTLYLHWLGNQ
jgi:hypothetical protein